MLDQTIQIEEDNDYEFKHESRNESDSDSFKEEELNECLSSWASCQLSRSRLKTASNNSAFFAGFGIISIVEVISESGDEHPLPDPLLYYLAITSVLQVAVHLMIILIGNCIIPHIDAAVEYCESYHELIEIESPHAQMKSIIDVAWIVSTTIGTILFMIQLISVVISKYWQYSGIGSPDYSNIYDLSSQGKLFGFVSAVILALTIVIAIIYFIYLYRELESFMRDRFRVKNKMRDSTVRTPSRIFFTQIWRDD